MSFVLPSFGVLRSMEADLLAAVGIGLSALGGPQASNLPAALAPGDFGPPPIVVEFLHPGTGVAAGAGDRVTVHFVVRNLEGRELANSLKRGMPFTVELDGMGSFWSTALDGLREGGKSRLKANTSVFFGKKGVLPIIPSDIEIEADLTVVKIQKATLVKK